MYGPPAHAPADGPADTSSAAPIGETQPIAMPKSYDEVRWIGEPAPTAITDYNTGLSKQTASRYQALARVPAAEFESGYATRRAAGQ